MIITTGLNVAFNVAETLSYGTATNQTVNSNDVATFAWANGTSAGLNDLHWEKKAVVLASGADVIYTLSALADDLGRTVALVHAHVFGIHVTSRTSGDTLIVGNNGTNPWAAPFGATGVVNVFDSLLLASVPEGYAITSGSSDRVKIHNAGANSITFNIYVSGRSV